MATLGIYDEVRRYLYNIYLWEFADHLRKAKTYIRHTLEFLSTLRFDGKALQCRLCNKSYCTPIAALLLPKQGQRTLGLQQEHQDLWEEVAMNERKVYVKNSRCITNAALQYAHLVLSYSIFATRENSTEVPERGIFFLMNISRRDVWPIQPDIGYFIEQHLKEVANDKHNNRVVTVGGLITLIARYHDIDIDGQEEPFRLSCINITYLNNMGHIVVTHDRTTGDLYYRLRIRGGYMLHIHTDEFPPKNDSHARFGSDGTEADEIEVIVHNADTNTPQPPTNRLRITTTVPTFGDTKS